MPLSSLTDILYNAVLSWCTVAELGRMESVRAVPGMTWAAIARKRAGPPWQSSKKGLQDMHRAIFTIQEPVGITARCFADHADGTRAFGLDNGYCVRNVHVPGRPVDSIAWHDHSLLVCSQTTGWAYTASWKPVCACLCVSGPVDLRGTVNGTVPVCALPYPCTRIVQSSRRIAAWHVSGHVSVFLPSLHVVAVCDTCTPSPTCLSVIGDVVCVAGFTWHDEQQTGQCPCDTRDAHGTSYKLLT